MSQAQQILEFMRHEGPITPLIALKRFGSFRLAARIEQLRRAGWLINAKMVKRGEKRYASYSLAHVKEGRVA
jgi:hypothetical protein